MQRGETGGSLCVKEPAHSLVWLQRNESGVPEIKRGCGWRQAADSREVREDWVSSEEGSHEYVF